MDNGKVGNYGALHNNWEDTIYIGPLKNQKPFGIGKLIFLNQNQVYEGDFENGVFHGEGTLDGPDYTYTGSF